MSDLEKEKAEMLTAALVSSGLLATIEGQINSAVTKGTVTIAQAKNDKKILVEQAAETMAKGLEGAFNYLILKGFRIERIEDAEDTSMATERGTESEGWIERKGQSVSEGTGLEPEGASEGNTERSGGDET
jgi:hypothetical protein